MDYFFLILISILLISGCSSSKPQEIMECGNALGCEKMVYFKDSIRVEIPYDTVYLSILPLEIQYLSNTLWDTYSPTSLITVDVYGEKCNYKDSILSTKEVSWSHDSLFIVFNYYTD